MALQAIVDIKGVYRVILEHYPEGVYVLIFESPDSQYPYKDYLQLDWDMAKRACFQDFGISDEMWHEVPDTGLM